MSKKIEIHCDMMDEHDLLILLKCVMGQEYMDGKYWRSDLLKDYLIKFVYEKSNN